MRERFELNQNWKFKVHTNSVENAELPENIKSQEWLSATVPGTIHTDLLNHDLIADPFYRDNERNVQWVDKFNWDYCTTFSLPASFSVKREIRLIAEGLDTVADIFLNGKKIAHTENMHIRHSFEIKSLLNPGENELKILFFSPTTHAKQLEKKYGQLCNTHEPHRLYMRKAQYSFGWDWGPVLATSGIWKAIYLEGVNETRIDQFQVETQLAENLQSARVMVAVATQRFGEESTDCGIEVEIDGITKNINLRDETAECEFEINHPRLWWPAGFGEPCLYTAKLRLYADGILLDEQEKRFGIRKLELVRNKDKAGESFYFKINNQPVFCKGTNWIPADSFLPRINDEKYRDLLSLARDANMNIIRIWGGGIYEQDIFYDLCDELGLMVWQDFMFACGAYPEYDAFQENVKQEAEFVINRLRHHPSIVLWCGNNENEWIWHDFAGNSYAGMPGLTLFRDLIAGICAKHDPSRPYWQSTPFGGNDPNSELQGNRHQWDIWSRWQNFTTVENDRSRFISEFGFQGPANLSTFQKITLPEDRHPQSEVMEFHNKQIEGPERIYRFLAGHVIMPVSFEDYIYKGQMLQGEALKTCLEHWRRNKFHTAGSIIWQLNDCWPVTSWAIIDSDLLPKAAYFYVRRAFSPLLVSFKQVDNTVEIWLTNDRLDDVSDISLSLQCLDFDGKNIFSETLPVRTAANSSSVVHKTDLTSLEINSVNCYLKAQIQVAENVVSENRFFFKRFKHLDLLETEIQQTLEQIDDQQFTLYLQSKAFVKNVQVETDLKCALSDNFFDLDANYRKSVTIHLKESKSCNLADFGIRHLLTH